jgi:hypothetical protein
MTSPLVVSIPDDNSFYSLYADGIFSRKTYLRDSGITLFTYPENALLVLYYTYPTHRAACVVRNAPSDNPVALPGLSSKTALLFTVHASGVDKLRRAVAFLNKHSESAYSFGDGFYIRLYFLLCQRGKLNYPALKRLALASPALPSDACGYP